jgi:nucleotide-binding universal stress UspA family protein
MTLRTILCATDFSAPSDRALEHAIALAERSKARLELIHVHEPWIIGMAPELGGDYMALDEQLLASFEERMRERVATLRKRLPNVDGKVMRGFAAHGVVTRADETGADLVVLATTGHSAFAHAIMGSVADRVLRTIQRPLLLVPGDRRDVSLVPRRMIVPTDFSAPAKEALRVAVDLATEIGATVEVIHAFELPPYLLRTPGVADEVRRAIDMHVKDEMSAFTADPSVETRTIEGDPKHVLLGEAVQGAADLIVIGSTGRNALSAMIGGVTDKVVRGSRVPVLVVRGPQGAS